MGGETIAVQCGKCPAWQHVHPCAQCGTKIVPGKEASHSPACLLLDARERLRESGVTNGLSHVGTAWIVPVHARGLVASII